MREEDLTITKSLLGTVLRTAVSAKAQRSAADTKSRFCRRNTDPGQWRDDKRNENGQLFYVEKDIYDENWKDESINSYYEFVQMNGCT